MALLLSPLTTLPVIAFDFFREIEIHRYLDDLLGTRRDVDKKIVALMSGLAQRAGYEHSSRIRGEVGKATMWFYSYINSAGVTRIRAFEIWEAYYVGLYISAASALSIVMCFYLALISAKAWIALSALLPSSVFFLVWGHRRFHVIPKIMNIPVQQIADIPESEDILAEARRRFG